MADFGAVFDKSKAAAEAKIQGYRDADQRSQKAQADLFAEVMRPLNTVVWPILEKARESLATRDVNVQIDHDEFYNFVDGKRIPAIHFQMFYAELRSNIYTFEIRDRQFSCNADDGSKKPSGQRMGVFATSSNNVTPSIVEEVVSRAINDVMQDMEQREVKKIFPGASPGS